MIKSIIRESFEIGLNDDGYNDYELKLSENFVKFLDFMKVRLNKDVPYINKDVCEQIAFNSHDYTCGGILTYFEIVNAIGDYRFSKFDAEDEYLYDKGAKLIDKRSKEFKELKKYASILDTYRNLGVLCRDDVLN